MHDGYLGFLSYSFYPIFMRTSCLSFLLIFGLGTMNAQDIPSIDFPKLEAYMTSQGDTTVVYNFWATWCRPCVAELPYFVQLDNEYADRPLKVVFVSLDFPDQKARMEAFIARKGITQEVIHLDVSDQNAMINGIDPKWSGAIPATLIVGPNTRAFKEQSFTYEELTKWVASVFL